MKELDLGNTSFYDFPTIAPKGNDVPADGPVKDIPNPGTRLANMVAMKVQVPGNNKIVATPENEPRTWNSGGNGQWWDTVNNSITGSKKPING